MSLSMNYWMGFISTMIVGDFLYVVSNLAHCKLPLTLSRPLHWRHNDYDGVSNHQPHGCLLNRLFRRRSKKTWKLRVTGLCVWNSPGPVNSPHKGPVTRKMFPFDDVIMSAIFLWLFSNRRRTFAVLWLRTGSIMEVLPRWIRAWWTF